ncbi:MAG TPA: CBS domain-containing protein, partial [Bacteroidales bacterium]|nr:CBS domain-containing protein [Bacteroidales bacterium]
EIARIVESDDAKVLSLYIRTLPDSTRMEITLKVNKMKIPGMLQTFHRYNYLVTASFSEGETADDLRDRYNLLMYYLNT